MAKKYIKGTNLYVSYTYKESGGEICPGQEDTDWPSYEPLYRDSEVLGITLKDIPGYCDVVEVSFTPKEQQKVYLVSVTYQSGGTFITTFGNIGFEGIYQTFEEAETIAKSIREDTYDGHKFWQGYFERLENIEVEEYIINERPKKLRY